MISSSSAPAIYESIKGDVNPLPDHILVHNMEKGGKVTKGGIIIGDDNGKDRGIRPRWAQVYKVGSRIDYVQPGEWILLEHGRWTYGINVETGTETVYLQRIDNEAILLVSDECPIE